MNYKFINIEYLDTVSGGEPEVINEIVVMFKDQVVEIYKEMRSLLSEKKYESLGLLAHKAKSSVAIMGMNELATMLKTFEIQGREGRQTDLFESYIERFKEETDIAVTELEDVVSNRLKKC